MALQRWPARRVRTIGVNISYALGADPYEGVTIYLSRYSRMHMFKAALLQIVSVGTCTQTQLGAGKAAPSHRHKLRCITQGPGGNEFDL